MVSGRAMGFDYSKIRDEVQRVSLNDLLDRLEVDISHIGQENMENAQNLLVKMDEAQQRLNAMSSKQIPVKAEAAQFDYLVAEVERNAKNVLDDLGGQDHLRTMRTQRPSGQLYLWWRLDEIYANQKKKRLSRILMVAGTTGLLLALFVILYDAFLKPDPAVSGKYIHQMNAEQYLSQQNYPKAMDEINLALGFAPSDADLLVLRGVIQTQMGDNQQAEKDFDLAQTYFGNQLNFLLSRSQSWLTAGEYRLALEDSQAIIDEEPASAEGYLYFAKANEFLQNYQAAVAAYETASNLAASQGKTELNASIRISLAMLMQSFPGLQTSTQITPTP